MTADKDLIRRVDAREAALEADSLELAQYGANKIAERINSIPAETMSKSEGVLKSALEILEDAEREYKKSDKMNQLSLWILVVSGVLLLITVIVK